MSNNALQCDSQLLDDKRPIVGQEEQEVMPVRHRRRRHRSERGLALIWLKCDASDERLATEMAKIGLVLAATDSIGRLASPRPSTITVVGTRRKIERLAKLDFVARFAFESDRNQLLK